MQRERRVSASRSKSRSDDDELFAAVRVAVDEANARFSELRELETVAASNDKNVVADIIDRSGIGGKERDRLEELMRTFADGLVGASDRSEGPFDFTLDLDGEAGEVFHHALMQAARTVRKTGIDTHARFGALMLMSSNLETLIAKVADAIFRDVPEKLGGTTLTISQLEDLGSVSAARDFATQRAVDNLMHGGIADWVKHFGQFDINLTEAPPDWWAFREIDARRNLVAHADSKVNDLYLKIARENGAPAFPDLGQSLPVTSEYLVASSQTLSAFSTLFGVSVLLTRRPEKKERVYAWGVALARDFFQDGNDEACRLVTTKLIQISRGRLPRTLDLELRHLRWLAIKSEGGVEAIRSEVESFDYSGLDLELLHIRSMLLDQHEEARQQVSELVTRGTLLRSTVRLRREYADLVSQADDSWPSATN